MRTLFSSIGTLTFIAPSSLAGVTPANDDGAIKVKVGALMTVIFLMKMNPMKNKLQT